MIKLIGTLGIIVVWLCGLAVIFSAAASLIINYQIHSLISSDVFALSLGIFLTIVICSYCTRNVLKIIKE